MALLHPSHIRWPLARASEPGKRAVIVDENTGNDEGFLISGHPLAGIICFQHNYQDYAIQHVTVSILDASIRNYIIQEIIPRIKMIVV